ncbi:MAG: tripartite tricarboxylate transporter TctB family protein [Desulfobacteraceae bacterium]|nr:MAG: tripartite tricarboxylate transporter TctB family protein [Desulfobacteraceae bacterium]
MRTLDSASSLFWLLVSLISITASYRLGLGTVHNPGMGFLTFGVGSILGILSLALFLKAHLAEEVAGHEPLFAGKAWKRVLFVLTALIAYSVLMPVLGYLISTFMLMTLLFWILEKKKIGFVLLYALLTTLTTYLVFSKWLNCQFPNGPLGF